MSENKIIPKHIAVIMDGNGRWAQSRFLPRKAGHKAGAKAVRKFIENSVKNKIQALTLFAFSSENWQRPADEIENLLALFLDHLKSELPTFQRNNIKFQVIGDTAKFSEQLQQNILTAQQETENNTGLVLTVAASYGGRWDICQASKKIANLVLQNAITVDDIDESLFAQQLCLNDLPEPDLLVRTSGEYRISNFLLWQLSYAELYFIEAPWPDFDNTSFQHMLQWYVGRQRRYGKTADQISVGN